MKQYAKWMWLLIGLGFLAMAKGYTVTPFVQRVSIQQVTVLDEQWKCVQEEGNVQYQYRIPENMDTSLWMFIKNYFWEFAVYLDEEPVYASSDKYAMKGASQHLIQLPEYAAGKLLSVRPAKTKKKVQYQNIGHVFLGEENAVVIRLFLDNAYALLFLGFVFLFGVGLAVGVCYLNSHISREMFWGVWHLCVFILIAGIWVATDSGILLFVTDRTALISLFSFLSFMSMPVPLLLFISSMTGKNKEKSFLLCQLFLANVVLYLLNYLFPVIPGYLLLLPSHLLCFYTVFMLLRNGISERADSENKVERSLLWGIFLLLFCAVIAFLMYYQNPVSSYSAVYCIGIFLFIVCLICAVFQKLYIQMKASANAEVYKKLAYTDVMTEMKNRTAFMLEQESSYWSPAPFYVVMDVNYLKRINDQYGHHEGDALIVMAAMCIRETFAAYGECYRIGGDEFVVIGKSEWKTAQEVERMLQQLQSHVEKKSETREIPLALAAGYAVRQDRRDTAESLFKRADARMYEKKQKMKENFV